MDQPQSIRLNKFLAERLGLSRREADEIISAGKVKIDGQTAQLGARVDFSNKVWYNGNDMIDKTMTKFEEFIKNETLALELIKQENISEKYNINDIDCEIKIERI